MVGRGRVRRNRRPELGAVGCACCSPGEPPHAHGGPLLYTRPPPLPTEVRGPNPTHAIGAVHDVAAPPRRHALAPHPARGADEHSPQPPPLTSTALTRPFPPEGTGSSSAPPWRRVPSWRRRPRPRGRAAPGRAQRGWEGPRVVPSPDSSLGCAPSTPIPPRRWGTPPGTLISVPHPATRICASPIIPPVNEPRGVTGDAAPPYLRAHDELYGGPT